MPECEAAVVVAKKRVPAVLILAIVLGLIIPVDGLAQFSGFPDAGFSDDTVVSAEDLRLDDEDDPRPTSIAWLPDGDMLVITQQGGVFRDDGGTVVELLDLRTSICSFDNGFNNEMGLLGLAVDPDFSGDTGSVFLYYTERKGPNACANRVSRFTLGPGNAFDDEQVLLDDIPAPNGNHNGGDLQFGQDKLLYVSVGDGGKDLRSGKEQDENRNARRLDLPNGKILRITRDGGIPDENPFRGAGTAPCVATGAAERVGQEVGAEKKSKKQKRKAKKRKRQKRRDRQQEQGPRCQEIFATGLRNPYRIAFDPDGGERFYINDVGGNGFEEINAGAKGADYGWNVREGPCPINDIRPNCAPDNRFVDPVYAYRRQPPPDGCRTITGGAFVPNTSDWPELSDAYLFADLFCSRIFALEGQGENATVQTFASGGQASHMAFGPDGELYYASLFTGEVNKITFES